MTSHDEALRTLKPSSPSEELDSRILKGYCGVQGFGNPSPFHIKPKAHAEEEEMFEDEQRRSKLSGDVAKDNPVLQGRRKRHALKDNLPGRPKQKRLTQWASHGSMVEEQF